MKPNELYKRKPESVTSELDILKGSYYDHIPEVEPDAGYLHLDRPNEKVEIRYYKNHCFDGRRVWILAGVFFEDKPVMITQNAGREGDDHYDRFITDYNLYDEMVKYIISLIDNEYEREDCCDPDVDYPQLVDFYGNHLDGEFEKW